MMVRDETVNHRGARVGPETNDRARGGLRPEKKESNREEKRREAAAPRRRGASGRARSRRACSRPTAPTRPRERGAPRASPSRRGRPVSERPRARTRRARRFATHIVMCVCVCVYVHAARVSKRRARALRGPSRPRFGATDAARFSARGFESSLLVPSVRSVVRPPPPYRSFCRLSFFLVVVCLAFWSSTGSLSFVFLSGRRPTERCAPACA